jgi:hypothetical protein
MKPKFQAVNRGSILQTDQIKYAERPAAEEVINTSYRDGYKYEVTDTAIYATKHINGEKGDE